MKILVVLASCAAVVSAGFAGFNGNSGGGNDVAYSAPQSSVVGGGGGGYSSDFADFGGQSNLGNMISAGLSNSGVRSNNVGFGRSNTGGLGNVNGGYQAQRGGQVRRFVSVHVAPEEEAPKQPRIIRAGGPPDTHYNIIFVKAPNAPVQKTEVVLPEPAKQKTLVYVLIKRPDENQETVKITKPQPTQASKPQVYFIRYKADGENKAAQGNAVGSSVNISNDFRPTGGFSGNANALDSSYGAPSQQNGGY